MRKGRPTGIPTGTIIDPKRGKRHRQGAENLIAKQKRLSGPLETAYDRDNGVGSVPENLKRAYGLDDPQDRD